MADDDSKTQKPVPDRVSWEQALKDIAPKGYGDQPHEELRRGTMMDDGTCVITYCFGQYPYNDEYGEFVPITDPKEQAMIRDAMRQIEAVANIRFEENFEVGDIAYLKGKLKDETSSGHMTYGSVFLSEERGMNADTVMHEILHALNMQHPGARGRGGKEGGDNPLYTTDTTLLSYNDGQRPQASLRDAEIALLVEIYGPSQQHCGPETLSADALMYRPFLYAREPASIRLGAEDAGDLTIDTDKGVIGNLIDCNGNGIPIAMRMTPKSALKDIVTDPNTAINLVITGNNLPNRLQGGKDWDALTPRGGGDTLTGRDGADRFIFDGKSGFDNVITDLEIIDSIVLKSPVAGVELEKRDGKNTLLTARDAAGERVASAYILNAGPETVSERIKQVATSAGGLRISIATATSAPTSSDDPMLPPPVTPSSAKAKTTGAGK